MAGKVSAARAAAITGAQNWDAVRDRYPEHVDAMADGLLVGDPLADAVIDELFSGAGNGGEAGRMMPAAPTRGTTSCRPSTIRPRSTQS